MTWFPIETAPKDGTEILLARGPRVVSAQWVEPAPSLASEYHANGTYLGEFETGDQPDPFWMTFDGGFSDEQAPTHWMPLPTGPVDVDPRCTCANNAVCIRCPIHNPSGAWEDAR